MARTRQSARRAPVRPSVHHNAKPHGPPMASPPAKPGVGDVSRLLDLAFLLEQYAAVVTGISQHPGVACPDPGKASGATLSSFRCYSHIRSSIAEKCLGVDVAQDTCFWQPSSQAERESEQSTPLSKAVQLGITGVFTLLQEVYRQQPSLCTKTVSALRKLLDSLEVESMNREPEGPLNELERLLCQIGTGPMLGSKAGAEALGAFVTSSLTRGRPASFLSAVSTLLSTSLRVSTPMVFETPRVLQKFVQEVGAVGTRVPQALLPEEACCAASFVTETGDGVSALTTDGTFVFLRMAQELVKVGSGYHGTEAGLVYARHRLPVARSASIAAAAGLLFIVDDAGDIPSGMMRMIPTQSFDKESLRPVSAVSNEDHEGELLAVLNGRDGNIYTMEAVSSQGELRYFVVCRDGCDGSLDEVSRIELRGSPGVEGTGLVAMGINMSVTSTEPKTLPGKTLRLSDVIISRHRFFLMDCNGEITNLSNWSVPISSKLTDNIVHVATNHTSDTALFVTKDGLLFRGETGISGSGPFQLIRVFMSTSEADVNTKVVYGATGHSEGFALITEAGTLMTWGKNKSGELGQVTSGFSFGGEGLIAAPQPVSALEGVPVKAIAMGDEHTVVLLRDGSLFSFGNNSCGQCGRLSDERAEPGKIETPSNDFVQVVCGSQHTIALTESGLVFTFGDNTSGQLGLGDMTNRFSPCLVETLAGKPVKMVAAGEHHSLFLLRTGELYGCGQNSSQQLGETIPPQAEPTPKRISVFKNAVPSFISAKTNMTCVYAFDSTPAFGGNALAGCSVFVTGSDLVVMSSPATYKKFSLSDGFTTQETTSTTPWTSSSCCMDPTGSFLWGFDATQSRISRYHHTGLSSDLPLTSHAIMAHPFFSLPPEASSYVSLVQAAIALLSCVDNLVLSNELASAAPVAPEPAKTECVTRFRNEQEGWYYGNSKDAITFTTSEDIKLTGLRLYGGGGEYRVTIQVLAGQSDCGPRPLVYFERVIHCFEHTFEVSFDEPASISSGCEYTIAVLLQGQSSWYGSDGQGHAEAAGVLFRFLRSNGSDNGTNVDSGQIPGLLFQKALPPPEPTRELPEPLGRKNFLLLDTEALHAVYDIANLCWTTLHELCSLGPSAWQMTGESSSSFRGKGKGKAPAPESRVEGLLSTSANRHPLSYSYALLAVLRLLEWNFRHETFLPLHDGENAATDRAMALYKLNTFLQTILRTPVPPCTEVTPSFNFYEAFHAIRAACTATFRKGLKHFFPTWRSKLQLAHGLLAEAEGGSAAACSTLSGLGCPDALLDAVLSEFVKEPRLSAIWAGNLDDGSVAMNSVAAAMETVLATTGVDSSAMAGNFVAALLSLLSRDTYEALGKVEAMGGEAGVLVSPVRPFLDSAVDLLASIQSDILKGTQLTPALPAPAPAPPPVPVPVPPPSGFGMGLVVAGTPGDPSPTFQPTPIDETGGSKRLQCVVSDESFEEKRALFKMSQGLFVPPAKHIALPENVDKDVARKALESFCENVLDRVEELLSSIAVCNDFLLPLEEDAAVPRSLHPFLQSQLSSSRLIVKLFPITLLSIHRGMGSAVHTLLPKLIKLLARIDALVSIAPLSSSEPSSCLHRIDVETPHPYPQAMRQVYDVRFPEGVQCMVLDFDSRCGTRQAEDCLRIYLDGSDGTKIHVSSFGVSGSWPGDKMPLVLPGNRLTLDFDTATDYHKDQGAATFGFRVVVTGHSLTPTTGDPLVILEKEVAHLAGVGIRECIAYSESHPQDLTAATAHFLPSDLFQSGFWEGKSDEHDGGLSEGSSNERSFLDDFVLRTVGTPGARLAQWLQGPLFSPSGCIVFPDSLEGLAVGQTRKIPIQLCDDSGAPMEGPLDAVKGRVRRKKGVTEDGQKKASPEDQAAPSLAVPAAPAPDKGPAGGFSFGSQAAPAFGGGGFPLGSQAAPAFGGGDQGGHAFGIQAAPAFGGGGFPLGSQAAPAFGGGDQGGHAFGIQAAPAFGGGGFPLGIQAAPAFGGGDQGGHAFGIQAAPAFGGGGFPLGSQAAPVFGGGDQGGHAFGIQAAPAFGGGGFPLGSQAAPAFGGGDQGGHAFGIQAAPAFGGGGFPLGSQAAPVFGGGDQGGHAFGIQAAPAFGGGGFPLGSQAAPVFGGGDQAAPAFGGGDQSAPPFGHAPGGPLFGGALALGRPSAFATSPGSNTSEDGALTGIRSIFATPPSSAPTSTSPAPAPVELPFDSLPLEIDPTDKTRMILTWAPVFPGEYDLEVLVEGRHVLGSPFQVTIEPAPTPPPPPAPAPAPASEPLSSEPPPPSIKEEGEESGATIAPLFVASASPKRKPKSHQPPPVFSLPFDFHVEAPKDAKPSDEPGTKEKEEAKPALPFSFGVQAPVFSFSTAVKKDEEKAGDDANLAPLGAPPPPIQLAPEAGMPIAVPLKPQFKGTPTLSLHRCARAAFAAYIWHHGLVEDAIVCAAFLRFHSTRKENQDVPEALSFLLTKWSAIVREIQNRATADLVVEGMKKETQTKETKETKETRETKGTKETIPQQRKRILRAKRVSKRRDCVDEEKEAEQRLFRTRCPFNAMPAGAGLKDGGHWMADDHIDEGGGDPYFGMADRICSAAEFLVRLVPSALYFSKPKPPASLVPQTPATTTSGRRLSSTPLKARPPLTPAPRGTGWMEQPPKPFLRTVSDVIPLDVNEQKKILSKTISQMPSKKGGGQWEDFSLLATQSPAMIAAEGRPLLDEMLAFFQHLLDGKGNLGPLESRMRQQARKAHMRAEGLRNLHQVLQHVTVTDALQDVLWHTALALHSIPHPIPTTPAAGAPSNEPRAAHYLADLTGCGVGALQEVKKAFHETWGYLCSRLNQLPDSPGLKMAALNCWDMEFVPQHDHTFLHECQIFSHIRRFMSRGGETDTVSTMGEVSATTTNDSVQVFTRPDITNLVKLKASSQEFMLGSLLDGSTESFWESGPEDNERAKTITLHFEEEVELYEVAVHLDNGRDHENACTVVSLSEASSEKEICKVTVPRDFQGWLSLRPEGDTTVAGKAFTFSIQALFMGHVSARVRLIRAYGRPVVDRRATGGESRVEGAALHVFQGLASQVFSGLMQETIEASPTPRTAGGRRMSSVDSDLRGHVVGVLFDVHVCDRDLSLLQEQVFDMIFTELQREATFFRGEAIRSETPAEEAVEAAETAEATLKDAYCFELVLLVYALSGSPRGRKIVMSAPLVSNLLTLLATGTPRVQRHCLMTLQRILPRMHPEELRASITCDADVIQEGGPIRFLLACVAKALHLQVRGPRSTKGSTDVDNTVLTVESVSERAGESPWHRGKVDISIAHDILCLLLDLRRTCVTRWGVMVDKEVNECLQSLYGVEDDALAPEVVPALPKVWLALAGLILIGVQQGAGPPSLVVKPSPEDQEDSAMLAVWVPVRESSGEGTQQGIDVRERLCDNDEESVAVLYCAECREYLCCECDRVLHLSRSKRNHQRTFVRKETLSLTVKNGCARAKLPGLLAVTDVENGKAVLEFRRETAVAKSNTQCRYCGASLANNRAPPVVPFSLALEAVCTSDECIAKRKGSCTQMHACGHPCGGVRGEDTCLPCMHAACVSKTNLTQDGDDYCTICWVEPLSAAPCVMLGCGHVFHYHCVRTILEKRWPDARITFGFLYCPLCRDKPMEHPLLTDLTKPILELLEEVRTKARMRLSYEGLEEVEAIVQPGGRYYNDPTGYAMHRFAYYPCFKCKHAYYGGEHECAAAVAGDTFDPEELICGGCSPHAAVQNCPKHGTDYLEFKCRFCCSVAVFFCFGTTHFCNSCHSNCSIVLNCTKLPACPAGSPAIQLTGSCPLRIPHPPTGEEFALGCGICRNAKTF